MSEINFNVIPTTGVIEPIFEMLKNSLAGKFASNENCLL